MAQNLAIKEKLNILAMSISNPGNENGMTAPMTVAISMPFVNSPCR